VTRRSQDENEWSCQEGERDVLSRQWCS